MDLVTLVQRWPVAAVVMAVGAGSGIVVCVLGIPALWSAEAAGWASAAGTVAAVFAAVHLAQQQSKKADREQALRAKWVSLELRHVLAKWSGRVAYIAKVDDIELYRLLGDDAFPSPSDIPPGLAELRPDLHELGDDAGPIAEAIWIARELSKMPVRDAISGNLGHFQIERDVIAQYRAGMKSLWLQLSDAGYRVSRISGLNTPSSNRTFG